MRLPSACGLALIILAFASSIGEAQDGVWSELSPNQDPFARANHATVYDSAHDRMLIFGGNGVDGTPLDEVWALSLGGTPTLTQVATQGGGAIGAAGATAIYDPVRDRLVVFGGNDPGSTAGPGPGITYELPLSGGPATWSVVSVAGTAPPNRYSHTAIYDASRDRMIVFGGQSFAGGLLSDVWALSFSGAPTWTQLTSAPAPRYFHTAIYDGPRDRMIVYGGAAQNQIFDDAIAFSLSGSGSWLALSPSGTAPMGRFSATAVVDAPRDRMLLFSGLDYQSNVLTDTWSLSLTEPAAWTRLFPSGAIPVRPDNFASIYDPVRQRMLSSLGDEFWSLGNLSGTPAWTQISVPGQTPLPRVGATFVYDSAGQRAVMFGGLTAYGFARDLWTYAPGSGVWSRVPRTVTWPGPRKFGSAISDPAAGRMILFGGSNLGVDGVERTQNDTWQLSLTALTWTRLTPGGTPPPQRNSHVAILDQPRNRMIVHGGYNTPNGAALSDTWSLSLAEGTSWSPLSSGPQMAHHVAVFDVPRDRMLVYGGSQVWALGLAGTPAWSAVSTNGVTPSLQGPFGAYDTNRDRMLVMLGEGSSASFALDLTGTPTWSSLVTGTPPAARGYSQAIWDADNDRTLLFGGGTLASGAKFNDVQAFAFSSPSHFCLATTTSPAGGGTVQRDPSQACFEPNSQVTLTAVPDPKYVFTGWSGDASGMTNPLTVTIDGPKNITANFLSYSLTTNASPLGGGTVTRNPNQPSFTPGSQVTLTAVPDAKYAFTGWSGDATGMANPLTVTMDGPKNITANFLTHSLTTIATPPSGGTLARSPNQPSFAPGSQVTLTANPSPSYGFTGWSGDASGTTNPLTLTMDGPKTITATFATYALATQASPTVAGAVQRSPNAATYPPGTQVTLTASGNFGCSLINWSGDASGNDNPLTVTMDGPKNITANFSGHYLTVAVSPNGAGSVPQSPNQPIYAPGAQVTLTAQASRGYLFDHWTGDAGGSTNPLTLSMDADKLVTANFGFAPPACGNWTLASNSAPPRAGAAVAWDAVNARVLLFGGADGTVHNDLWSYTAAQGWTLLSPLGTPPSPRAEAGFVYDPVRSRMLLIGGDQNDSGVWELSLSGTPTWTQLAPAGTAPAPSYEFATIYDPVRDRVILVSGYYVQAEQVWSLDLTGTPTWSQLATSGSPPSPLRYGMAAIYDPLRDRMLLHGGTTFNGDDYRSETWSLSLSGTPAWTQVLAFGYGPPNWVAPSSYLGTATYDPIRDRMLIVGGFGTYGDDPIWSLSLEGQPSWMRLPTGGLPLEERYLHGAVYEPDVDALLVIGGSSYELLTDVMRLDCAGGYWLETGGDQGTISRIPQKACYGNGEVVSLLPTAQPSYAFQNWLGDASGKAQPLEVTMDGNKAIQAHFFTGPVAVADPPLDFALEEIRPNPNTGPATIAYTLPVAAKVRLAIYDVTGRQVSVLASGVVEPGRHTARWDGRVNGAAAKAGVYFVRYETPVHTWNKRLVLLR